MEKINRYPIYASSLSSCSNLSYLSNSSGFESLTDFFNTSSDLDLGIENESCLNHQASINDLNQSLDSLMDSDVFGNNPGETILEIQNSNEPISLNIFTQQQNNKQPFFFNNSFNTVTHQKQNIEWELNELNQENQNTQSIQLWQFLVELLEDKQYRHLIKWVNSPNQSEQAVKFYEKSYHDNEFVLLDSNEIAKLWGMRRNKPAMNFKKFKRSLRYYYNKKNILKKAAGKHNHYYFQINIQPYIQHLNCMQEQLNKKNQIQQYTNFFQQQQSNFFQFYKNN